MPKIIWVDIMLAFLLVCSIAYMVISGVMLFFAWDMPNVFGDNFKFKLWFFIVSVIMFYIIAILAVLQNKGVILC